MITIGYEANEKDSKQLIGFHTTRENKHKGNVITDQGEAHLLTIAPTGAGKGRGNIIPACLEYPGPMVVLDIKGEAAQVTMEHRKKFGKVCIIDPFKKVVAKSDIFNPLSILTNYPPEEIGIMLAKAFLQGKPSNTSDHYWDDAALEILSGLMIHELATTKSILNIRNMLYHHDADFELASLLDSKKVTNQLAYDLIGSYLSIPSDKTRPCVLSSARQLVTLLGDPAISASMEGPASFTTDELLSGAPLTIYLVIPPNKISAYSSVIRLWIIALMSVFTERTTKPELPTLMILDECANLGRLEPFITAITLMRSYGVRVWSLFQDLGQLKSLYPTEWTSIINNCDMVQAYGVRNYLIAKELSALFGIFTSEQLLHLKDDEAILSQSGKIPHKMRRLDYLNDERYKNITYQHNKFYNR